MTSIQFLILLLIVAVFVMVIGQMLHSVNGDLLPPVGQWTNCRNLPEVCDVPSWESNDPSNITVYRFENGSMILYNFELGEFRR